MFEKIRFFTDYGDASKIIPDELKEVRERIHYFEKELIPEGSAGLATEKVAFSALKEGAGAAGTVSVRYKKGSGYISKSKELDREVWESLPPNIRSAEIGFADRIQSFYRAPISDEIREHFYYLEDFSIFTCGGSFFTRRKDYDSYQIIYTYEGCAGLEYEGRTYTLNPGDGFFLDCRRPHYYYTKGGYWKHSVFHFNGPALPILYEEFLKTGSVIFHQPVTGSYQTHLEQLLEIYQSISPVRDYQASDCISTIVTDILVSAEERAVSQAGGQDENLRYLAYYMEQHFSEPLSLDFLSRLAGLSKFYLSRKFKKFKGFAPGDYLVHLRIERAKELLKSTELPAAKVGVIVGIGDVNNFTNLFRKKTGMTPGQYRVN